MNAWQNSNYPMLDLRDHRMYRSLYRDRTVSYTPTETLFIGSCDISGNRQEKYWHEIYAESKNIQNPVTLGQPIQSFSSLMRVLYTYLKNTSDSPKKILMVVPMTSPEHVINGTCYSVNHRTKPVEHLIRLNIIPEKDVRTIIALHSAYKKSDSDEERIYDFCKEFSFLEMMCKSYNIQLRWTFNITITGKDHYFDYDLFANSHDFARDTYIGMKPCDDYDDKLYCPTALAHKTIAELFLENDI